MNKATFRYQIKVVRQVGNQVRPIAGEHSSDLEKLIALADAKRPAFVVDNWAKPTPAVVYVAAAL